MWVVLVGGGFIIKNPAPKPESQWIFDSGLFDSLACHLFSSMAFLQSKRLLPSEDFLLVRGERPILDEKYDLHKHVNVKYTEDGGAPPYD